MDGKKTGAGLAIGTVLMTGAIDATTLKEVPLERVEIIAEERVEAKQIGDTVETTFPWKDQEGIKVTYDMGEPTIAEKFKDKRNKEVITETLNTREAELQRKRDQIIAYKTDIEELGTSTAKIDGLVIAATSTEQKLLIAEQELWSVEQDLEVRDGFKIDVLLNEKPDTNRFCYLIEGAEQYDFFYQPPLTPEEIEQGAERPPEIEGSYAVYHKTLKNHQVGKENYATGKVMHIPRPQVWELDDEENTKEWAELSYDEKKGELCVTARQEFLDEANYPVRIDPTFGYTTQGGTTQTIYNSTNGETAVLWSRATLPETATIDSMHGYLFKTSGGSFSVATSIYDTSGNRESYTNSTAITTTSYSLYNFTFTSPPALAADDYYIGANNSVDGSTNTSQGTRLAYDAAGAISGNSGNYTPAYPPVASFTPNQTLSRIFSIYATYTASGGGGAAPAQDVIWFD